MAADFLRAMQRESVSSTTLFSGRGLKTSSSGTGPPGSSNDSNIRLKLQALSLMLFGRSTPQYSSIPASSSQPPAATPPGLRFFLSRWRKGRWIWGFACSLALCGFIYFASARGPTSHEDLETSEHALRDDDAVLQNPPLEMLGEAKSLSHSPSWRLEAPEIPPPALSLPAGPPQRVFDGDRSAQRAQERSRNNLEFGDATVEPQSYDAMHARPPIDRPAVFQPRSSKCLPDDRCDFLIIADLDQASKVSSSPLFFKSYLLGGSIWELDTSDPSKREFEVSFHPTPVQLTGKHNEAGRGLELSELLLYKGKLLTFDDRTGIIYELLSHNGTVQLVPRHLLTEASGDSVKGMKSEWATEKDGVMWIGSFGKEFTDPQGKKILSEANFWTATVDTGLNIRYHNWKQNYNKLRDTAGFPYPGYLLHEAVNWSKHLNKWVFVPRRASVQPYDEIADERRGTNLVLLASDDFSTVNVHTIGPPGPVEDPQRGTSSFKFLPASNDTIAIGIKSTEDSQAGQQRTYINVFETLTGRVLMADVQVPFAAKFEGLEFLSSLSYQNFFPSIT